MNLAILSLSNVLLRLQREKEVQVGGVPYLQSVSARGIALGLLTARALSAVVSLLSIISA